MDRPEYNVSAALRKTKLFTQGNSRSGATRYHILRGLGTDELYFGGLSLTDVGPMAIIDDTTAELLVSISIPSYTMSDNARRL